MIKKTHPRRFGQHNRPTPSSSPANKTGEKPDRLDMLINKATSLVSGLGQTSKYTASRQNLRIIPMGGVEEVGENMTAIEFGDDIIVIDMGLAFPDDTMPGIDYIIPDTKWLEENKRRIRGVVITHGHLDHIGAVPYILPKLGDPPVYTMALTAGFIKKRLEEFGLLGRSKINVLTKDDVLPLGNFKIRFFRTNHSIPDGMGLCITTPVGQIIYATDWKFDHTPADGKPTEFDKIAKFGAEDRKSVV